MKIMLFLFLFLFIAARSSLVIRVLACLVATGTLAYADDRSGLYFDVNSLVWMLIGALVWSVVFYLLDRLPGRRDVSSNSIHRPTLVRPVGGSTVKGDEKTAKADKDSEFYSEYLTPLDETTTVTVEELSSIVEQVDLFLMLGRKEMAVNMLLARIGLEEGNNDPRVWFKLLDIYHSQGDRDNFDKLANDIRVRFNVALPSWEDSTLQAKGRHGLEHFPHLLARISDCWGSSCCLSYLQSLVQDNRSGARSGFNEDAFREVMFLISILEETGPQ